MTLGKAKLTIMGLTGAALLYTVIVWGRIPSMMPMHWNLLGRIDAWAPKAVVSLLLIGLAAALPFALLTWPKVNRLSAFGQALNRMACYLSAMFVWLQFLTIQAAMSQSFPAFTALLGSLFLLFLLLGPQLRHLRPNRWAGYRVPWTMKDPVVWDETHQFASKAMTAAGAVGLALMVLSVPAAAALGVSALLLTSPMLVARQSYRRRHQL